MKSKPDEEDESLNKILQQIKDTQYKTNITMADTQKTLQEINEICGVENQLKPSMTPARDLKSKPQNTPTPENTAPVQPRKSFLCCFN